jgi:nicotinate-nucleotide pyrophosphorylase (carboxylating)
MNTQADDLIRIALEEDIGTGDRTTMATIPEDSMSKARIVAKSDVVVAGMPYFARVYELLDAGVSVTSMKDEGELVVAGTVVAEITGSTRSILTGERVALNILQRLAGVATMTRRYADALAHVPTRVVDTRKTTPGMRAMQKYAVRTGGGHNHRFGLDSGILIKDNHITACGSIQLAVERARDEVPHLLKIQVETTTLQEVEAAVECSADVILLDNMSAEMMTQAVKTVRSSQKNILTEASGNVTLARIQRIAETGVDYISVGALTHSVIAADLSLEVLS